MEREEKVNYDRRMRSSWVKDVTALVSQLHGTAGPQKPYLTDAPAVIVVMSKSYDIGDAGERVPVYYPKESTGIAAGLLVAALHNANLVTLTSTPMGAERDIRRICSRPDNEKVSCVSAPHRSCHQTVDPHDGAGIRAHACWISIIRGNGSLAPKGSEK